MEHTHGGDGASPAPPPRPQGPPYQAPHHPHAPHPQAYPAQQHVPQAPYPQGPSAPPPGHYGPGYAPPGGHGFPGYAAPPPPRPPRKRGPSRGVMWTAITGSALVSVGAALTALFMVFAQSAQDVEPARSESISGEYAPALTERPGAVEVGVYDHPAYDLDMPATVDCTVPDLDPSSDASWEEFTAELGVCLNDLWRPRLEELGLRVADPEFATTDTDPTAFADDEGTTMAYYDGEEHVITVVVPNVTEISKEFSDRDQEAVWSALIGHEYGHHVQQVTGVLDQTYDMEVQAGSEEGSLRALRRTELQAECMGGIAMRGLGFETAEIERVNEELNGGGDLPTHGTSKNRRHWYEQGATGDTLSACNTFEAPAGEVS
ncbi:neutral zinc metallopeptidase [Nocardiopsis sp. RSe5-2]|uniref:Neutral zinc metallopeptidase n=1 Tax=Nocardiopsis endophytica TaxID=3018445 RepID=A0ABT4UD23_9ACTN|nr:neutral zinc metallopeptidase [Nocardiopsis endophytica]MDA2814792.1 neutral zinc metallopeptidase [Nocardiopsis endophytica]